MLMILKSMNDEAPNVQDSPSYGMEPMRTSCRNGEEGDSINAVPEKLSCRIKI